MGPPALNKAKESRAKEASEAAGGCTYPFVSFVSAFPRPYCVRMVCVFACGPVIRVSDMSFDSLPRLGAGLMTGVDGSHRRPSRSPSVTNVTRAEEKEAHAPVSVCTGQTMSTLSCPAAEHARAGEPAVGRGGERQIGGRGGRDLMLASSSQANRWQASQSQ